MKHNPFPHEYIIKLEDHPYLEGRIVVNSLGQVFSSEIDIIQAESRKIYHHVGILYGLTSEQEAVDQGHYKLAQFVQNPF